VTVNPTQAQVRQVATSYRQTAIADAHRVIEAFQELDTQVFIVSGGLIEPVRQFGVWLGLPRDHIYAVDVEYDQLAGQWWRYWEQPGGINPRANHLAVESSPLIGTGGKNRVIARLRREHPGRALLVGDGLSDLEAAGEVDLFVGFGGAVYRPRVAGEAPLYIHTPALSPLLPLALGQVGNRPRFAELWADGLRRIYAGEVSFRDPALNAAFQAAMRRGTG
jgi:phosphoserine phosphatase